MTLEDDRPDVRPRYVHGRLFGALEPFVARAPRGARCELCSGPLDVDHPHLADVEKRALACACRACAILFTGAGAANGRWRTVPNRYRMDPAFSLEPAA